MTRDEKANLARRLTDCLEEMDEISYPDQIEVLRTIIAVHLDEDGASHFVVPACVGMIEESGFHHILSTNPELTRHEARTISQTLRKTLLEPIIKVSA